jgi:hypothetical protein
MENIITKFDIEFDADTKQYTIINDYIPGVFGLWETLEDAIDEYTSCFKESILLTKKDDYESKTFA